MKNQIKFLVIAVIAIALFTSCADSQTNIQPCLGGHTYGFWGGLWHGLCAPFAFIGSLFDKDIAMWAVNNNGSWYTLGFVLGAGILGGGTGIKFKSKK